MDRPGYFIRPTIVRDIKEGSKLVDEEQFGPVLPMIKYSDNEDVIRRANATNYGLGASVWSVRPRSRPQRCEPDRSGHRLDQQASRHGAAHPVRRPPSSRELASNLPRKASPNPPNSRSSTPHVKRQTSTIAAASLPWSSF